MDMQFSEVGGVTKAVLGGRMDSLSVGEVETRFIAHVVPKEQPAVIDMAGVSFIASLACWRIWSRASLRAAPPPALG